MLCSPTNCTTCNELHETEIIRICTDMKVAISYNEVDFTSLHQKDRRIRALRICLLASKCDVELPVVLRDKAVYGSWVESLARQNEARPTFEAVHVTICSEHHRRRAMALID